jgi:hypothetical protein
LRRVDYEMPLPDLAVITLQQVFVRGAGRTRG